MRQFFPTFQREGNPTINNGTNDSGDLALLRCFGRGIASGQGSVGLSDGVEGALDGGRPAQRLPQSPLKTTVFIELAMRPSSIGLNGAVAYLLSMMERVDGMMEVGGVVVAVRRARGQK